MPADYPNMYISQTRTRVDGQKHGTLKFGYHADKVPVFAQAHTNTKIKINDYAKIQWLAGAMATLCNLMQEHAGNQPFRFVTEDPSGELTVTCLDGYLVTVTHEPNETIALAYRGVEMLAFLLRGDAPQPTGVTQP